MKQYTNLVLAIPHAVGEPLDFDWRKSVKRSTFFFSGKKPDHSEQKILFRVDRIYRRFLC